MTGTIRTLALRASNAYLVKGDIGYVLIDTGFRFDRSRLEEGLRAARCGPGDLRLIVVTHGDPDHSGNAAFLREAYGTRIAIHRAEAPAVERGDMFLSRGPLSLPRRLLKPIAGLFRLRKRDRFSPDLHLKDGERLDEHGLHATVLHVPGHSAGSIAVLNDDGDFFSGDFLENRRRPSIATLVDDRDALTQSFERIRSLPIHTVYPGHGAPFRLDEL